MGRPRVLQSMGSQRVRHNSATELNLFSNKVYFLKACVLMCVTPQPPHPLPGPVQVILPSEVSSAVILSSRLS